MSRLTEFISDPNEDKEYGIKGVCNYDLFGGIHHSQIPNLKKAIDKLAEYEDLGSVETIKSKLIEFNYLAKVHAMYGDNQQNFLNNQKLEHELEVYKRALKNEIPSNYYELEKVENEEQYIDLRLDKARKELEDDE